MDVEQIQHGCTAYGEVAFLDANFAEQTGNESPAEWEVLYAGYRFDAA